MILDDQRWFYRLKEEHIENKSREFDTRANFFFIFLLFLKFNSFPVWLGVLHVPGGEDWEDESS